MGISLGRSFGHLVFALANVGRGFVKKNGRHFFHNNILQMCLNHSIWALQGLTVAVAVNLVWGFSGIGYQVRALRRGLLVTDFIFNAHFISCLTYQSFAQKMNDASGVALKSVPWLSAKPTGLVCHDVETLILSHKIWRQKNVYFLIQIESKQGSCAPNLLITTFKNLSKIASWWNLLPLKSYGTG